MIVDDEQMILEIFNKFCKNLGFVTIYKAKNGKPILSPL